ncbi:hypothetical protein CMEL01_14788 [Colletotrichum melonis]|uniref:Uncharacterized protein n=1 Tax=Colletotrichum melonis TaxID=1209925 RepID=A0AAI9UPE0_9PEZI|nr:hypothetical protein CMEL01_14788 [Colletotrichum melonis]
MNPAPAAVLRLFLERFRLTLIDGQSFPSSQLPVSAKQRPSCSSAAQFWRRSRRSRVFAQGRGPPAHKPMNTEPNPRKTQFFCHCFGFPLYCCCCFAHIMLRLNDGKTNGPSSHNHSSSIISDRCGAQQSRRRSNITPTKHDGAARLPN